MAKVKEAPEVVATVKQVLVTLKDKNKPEYVFQGDWTGRDVKVVFATMSRAYRLQQLAARRSVQQALSEPTVPTTTEETNG